jgi:predicted metal-dependent HD superfamily phosphohydrolase
MENSIKYVKEKWKKLTSFSKKEDLKEQMWEEIVYRYSGQHRHYHTLNHIAHLYTFLDNYIGKITNPAVIGFAIMYHDVVYDTYSEDNEEQSAAFAEAHLKQLNVSSALIENVKTFIKATKDHIMPDGVILQKELSFFLDFDMAILGVDEDMYRLYSEKIREEYAKYPDDVYKEGRRLALEKVLSAGNIFCTTEFREEMEQRARENINRELSLL